MYILLIYLIREAGQAQMRMRGWQTSATRQRGQAPNTNNPRQAWATKLAWPGGRAKHKQTHSWAGTNEVEQMWARAGAGWVEAGTGTNKWGKCSSNSSSNRRNGSSRAGVGGGALGTAGAGASVATGVAPVAAAAGAGVLCAPPPFFFFFYLGII